MARLNFLLRLRFRWNQRLEPHHAAWLLALDIVELAVLLFLTGGLQNPFSFLFAGPVLISAAALPAALTLMLGGLAMICATLLMLLPLSAAVAGGRAARTAAALHHRRMALDPAGYRLYQHLCVADH